MDMKKIKSTFYETVAKHRISRRNRGGRGSKPQEYYLYFEDFEPKPDNEFGRKPKFCNGLYILLTVALFISFYTQRHKSMRIQSVRTKQTKARRWRGMRRTLPVRRNDEPRSNTGMRSYGALYNLFPTRIEIAYAEAERPRREAPSPKASLLRFVIADRN